LDIDGTLTRKEAQYLTLVYRKQVEDCNRVTTTTVSRVLKVTPATVTESFQKLAKKNLVEYTPYYGIKLTERGTAEAQKLLRRHRLLETLFVKTMNYPPKKACNEASKIDYYCSEALANNICSTYNHPVVCPCKKEIYADYDCKHLKNDAVW